MIVPRPASAESAAVLCIGGLVVDRVYRTASPLLAGTSNPVSSTLEHGGVARNIAANLAGLGVPARLLSAVGSEPEADAMIAALAAGGVDTRPVRRHRDAATASYVAVLDPDGALAFGLADMAIFERLTPALVASEVARADGWIFADLNLPAASLAAVIAAKPAGTRLAVDVVSVAKTVRLPERLAGIDLLCLNLAEARARAAASAPADLARDLLGAGAGAVLLTLGREGALAAYDGESGQPMHDLPACCDGLTVVSVTGAGDASVAGTIAGLRRGWDLARAVSFGMRLAGMTIGVEASVHPGLSPTFLESP